MYTMSNMPSTTSVVSTYTAFLASAMLVRSVIREVQSMTSQLIPKCVRDKIIFKFQFLFNEKPLSQMTLIIKEHLDGSVIKNEVYEASQLYLQNKISPCNNTLSVTKTEGDDGLTITVDKGEEIIDFYEGVRLRWVMVHSTKPENTGSGSSKLSSENKLFELSFLKIHKELIIGSYLPHILKLAKSRWELNRVIKLKSLGSDGSYGRRGSVNLNHPSTFETLALDPVMKKAIMEDLDRFVNRKDYYKRVGKVWKRGYLLYGPPGTGKSSLVAAMANYLKFHIYDLDLTSVHGNSSLRNMLVSTENRSIIVIEDIDCSIELQNRQIGYMPNNPKVTLSGLLNFIDGLWSSCGEERIIVFTTNYKDKLDPALLRPGRMDMHIHMSYLTPSAFGVLALNYLGVKSHPLFTQIEQLLGELEITPAAVAEELMHSDDDPDAALKLLLQFLQNKKSQLLKSDPDAEKESIEDDQEIQETV